MLVFFLSYLWLRSSEQDESKHYNDLAGISNVSDYTLLIHSFPPNLKIQSCDPAVIVQEEKKAEAWLANFFEQQVRAECRAITGGPSDDAAMMTHQLMDENKTVVHRVIAVSNQKEAIEFQKTMAPKRRQIDALVWKMRELEADKLLAAAEGDVRNVEYIEKRIVKSQIKKKKLFAKMNRLQKLFRSKQIRLQKVPEMAAAFVTFSTDLGRRVIWERYGHGGTCHRWCCQTVSKQYHGMSSPDAVEHTMITKVKLVQAPEPSTMLWQNIGYTLRQKICRRACTLMISLVLVGLAAVIVYLAKTSDPSSLGKGCLNTTSSNGTVLGPPGDTVVMFGQELSCEGWIKQVAQTNEYGDLSIACAPYTESITTTNLHLTSQSSLARTCGCRVLAFTAVRQQNKDIVQLCDNYINYVAIQNGLQVAAVMSVILVNIAYVVVAKKLGSCEHHASLDGQESSVALAVLLGSFLNTGLVMLFVNAKVDEQSALGHINTATASGGVDVSEVLKGKYSDFTANWYADVGVAITITMIIYVFSPHAAPLLRFCRFRCKERSGSTQASMNSKYVGPDFHHSIRYPQVSVVVFVSLAYSTGIPLLYLIVSITAFTFYWIDKYLFTRWYRTPPQYDAQISLQFSSYLPYAAVLHLLFGTWMIANRRMFSSDDRYVFKLVTTVINLPFFTNIHTFFLFFFAPVYVLQSQLHIKGCNYCDQCNGQQQQQQQQQQFVPSIFACLCWGSQW